jgi:hypothetical protein
MAVKFHLYAMIKVVSIIYLITITVSGFRTSQNKFFPVNSSEHIYLQHRIGHCINYSPVQ